MGKFEKKNYRRSISGGLKIRELKPYRINAGRTNTGSDQKSKRNTVDLKK